MEIVNSFFQYLITTGEYSERTLRAYKSDLRRFESYLSARIKHPAQVEDVSIKAIRDFLNAEKKQGLKASTLHRRKVSMHKLGEYLVEQGELNSIELKEITNWKQELWTEIANRKLQFLEEEQIAELFSIMKSINTSRSARDLAIISLILETSISIGDLVDINLSGIDIRNNQLRILDVDGERKYSIEESTPYIVEYLKVSRPELTQSTNEVALFVSQLGGRISRQGVWQMIKGWGNLIGLSEGLSPRVLRHSAAMRMVREGKEISEIQQMLGHTNSYSTRALVRKLKKEDDHKMEVM